MKDQSVVGYIVAGRRFLPIAYMIPMARAFEEISQRFGGVNVGIPGVQVELSSSERSASSGSGRVLQSGSVSVGEPSTALLASTDLQPLPETFQTSLERDSVTPKPLNVGTDTTFVTDGRTLIDEEEAVRPTDAVKIPNQNRRPIPILVDQLSQSNSYSRHDRPNTDPKYAAEHPERVYSREDLDSYTRFVEEYEQAHRSNPELNRVENIVAHGLEPEVQRLKPTPTENPSLDPKPASPNEDNLYLVSLIQKAG